VGPSPRSQIRWGLGASAAALVVVAVLALVPDPFFRHRAYTTALDDVGGVAPGTQVFFRGASVGEVTDVRLDPSTRNFGVGLSVSKDWRPSACNYVSVGAANPLTAPHVELVSIEEAAPRCRAALVAAGCTAIPPVAGTADAITGCRRAPDLIQTAAAAIAQAAAVAKSANAMATRLAAMLDGAGGTGGGSPVDMARLARDATGTVAALNTVSSELGRSLKPGQGDIAMTLANVRRLSGTAATLDVASVNGILRDTNAMIARNQENIAAMLADTRGASAQTRTMLEGLSASMVQASANLATVSDDLGTLTERLSADPTYAIRGTRFADPPAPGGAK
jgi:ABC-type transporter Mla subunit MlaD